MKPSQHGKTQNANEIFYSLISISWSKQLCMYDAISYFNYGWQSIIGTLKLLNVCNAGSYTTEAVCDANIMRKYNTGHGLKKKIDNIKTHECVTYYEAGGF